MENYKIKIKGECFIIPNKARKIEGFTFKESMQRKIAKLCIDNNASFDPEEDLLIQNWYCCEQSENISDHGLRFSLNGNKYYIDCSETSKYEYLPASLLPKKEGDTVTLLIKDLMAYDETYEYDNRIAVDLELTLTANQMAYRYRNFGTYEQVIEYVCS